MKNNAFTALIQNGGLVSAWEFVPDSAAKAAGVQNVMSKPLSLKDLDLIFIKVEQSFAMCPLAPPLLIMVLLCRAFVPL